jgi:membrane protein required for colicin V production
MAGGPLAAVDLAVLALLGLALVRGLWNGLFREALSLASLVAAAVAVRFLAGPLAQRLEPVLGAQLGPLGTRVLAALLLFVAVLVAGALLARLLRRSAQLVGLGWLDRLGGGALGLAEGAAIAIVALLISGSVLGRDHPLVSDSRAYATAQRVRQLARREPAPLPPVAAPPRKGDVRREIN